MRLYRSKDFPVKCSVSCDYILKARAASIGDHMIHVFNLSDDKVSLARATPITLFDDNMLRNSGVYVDRHNLGGAGFYCGTEDVVCSFHLNREILEDPEIPSLELFRECSNKICKALNTLGLSVSVRTEGGKNIRDGVCVNLEGRSEIVTEDGTKLAGGVFRDDGLVFTAYEVIPVSDAWTKIYDYLKGSPPRAKVTSLRSLVPNVDTEVVKDLVCSQLVWNELGKFDDLDFKSMRRLEPQFRYDKWQV